MTKKTVHYRGTVTLLPWGRAFVDHPIDHPDRLRVSNTKPVTTSAVESYDEATGRLETANTIYVKEAS